MSIVKELYRNGVFAVSRDGVKSEEFDLAMKELLEVEDELHKKAAHVPELAELIEQHRAASSHVNDMEQEEIFYQGFLFGLRMAKDVAAAAEGVPELAD